MRWVIGCDTEHILLRCVIGGVRVKRGLIHREAQNGGRSAN